MPYFKHDGIDFHYKDELSEGMPFIFLHGLGGEVSQPFSLTNSNQKIRRISIDFRGHGKTRFFGEPENFSFKVFADDVIKLMNHLEIEKAIIGGISTGAGVALNIALRYPEYLDRLVLSRIAWEDGPQPSHIQDAFAKVALFLEKYDVKNAKKEYMNTDIFNKMNTLSTYAGNSLIGQFDYPFIKETSEKLIRIPKDAPNFNREEWKKVKVPTLILANKMDPIHPFEYGKLIASYIPEAQFCEITSKTVSNENHTRETKELIDDFIL